MTSTIVVLGVGLSKHWFHVIGIDKRSRPTLRKKLNRKQLAKLTIALRTELSPWDPTQAHTIGKVVS
jgi:hypothetical protein